MKRIPKIKTKKLSAYAKELRNDMEGQYFFQTGKIAKSFKEVSDWTKKPYPNMHKHLFHKE